MITITIPEVELFDDEKEEFTTIKKQSITLEHSLLSISKWESKWEKPFLSDMKKTKEEVDDYIRCMTLTQNVDDSSYLNLTKENLDDIGAYIDAEMTATRIKNTKKGGVKERITSELIYYWMIQLNIPFECQKWHLNRLLTLINVCNNKNSPQKKMSKAEIIARNRELNEARRKKLNTNG